MNRLYKTYLMWRYLAQQSIQGDFGLRLKVENVDTKAKIEDAISDNILVLSDNKIQTSFTAGLITGATQLDFNSKININALENNYEVTSNEGLMFESQIKDASGFSTTFETKRADAIFGFEINDGSSFSAELYVDDVVPLIIFNTISVSTFISEAYTYPSDDTNTIIQIANKTTTQIDDTISDSIVVDMSTIDTEEEYKFVSYSSTMYAIDVHYTLDTNETYNVQLYVQNEFSIDINYFYDLDVKATFEVQESETTFLEHPTILVENGKATSTLSIDNIADKFNSKVGVENVITKPYFDLLDASQMNLFVSFDTDILIPTKVDLNTRVTQINAECDIEECDIKSYFIYSTYAKLNEYWDNTYTLSSMGNSTMDSLTYHEYSYN